MMARRLCLWIGTHLMLLIINRNDGMIFIHYNLHFTTNSQKAKTSLYRCLKKHDETIASITAQLNKMCLKQTCQMKSGQLGYEAFIF